MIEILNSPTLKTWDGNRLVVTGGRVILTVDADTLRGADLSRGHLDAAHLPGSDLRDVNFSNARLSLANFSGADLRGANLMGANLMGANLAGANLATATLNEAFLPGAHLEGADLSFTILQEAKLCFARYDETTLWPEGFDPEAAGAKRSSEVKKEVTPPGAVALGAARLTGEDAEK